MKRLFGLVMALLFLALLVGCETFRGFGKDMQRAGRTIERVSDR